MEQIHIALTMLGGIAISWMSLSNLTNPTIKYGLEFNLYKFNSQGYSTSYYQTFHSHVIINPLDLHPAQEYFYRKESDVPGPAKQASEGGPWTVFTDKNYFGAGLVNIINSTHMEFNYVRTSNPSEPYDSMLLIKAH